MDAKAQALLQSFVDEDISPGWAAAYATPHGISPVYVAGVSDIETKTPLKQDAIFSLFSSSKLVASLATLKALDQGLVKGMDLETGLDDAEALARFLPELAVGSDNTFMQIFDGWEDKEARKFRLRPAKKPVTLRHLLTFTAGSRGDFDDVDVAALVLPSASGVPPPFVISATSTFASLAQPRMAEAGDVDAFAYGGPAQDWIGVFLVRALGKTQRQIFYELVLEPLGISYKDYDYLTLEENRTKERKLPIWSREEHGWQQKYGGSMMEEWHNGAPDKDHHERSQAAFNGTVGSMMKIVHAVLTRSPKLLSLRGWDLALQDDLAHRAVQTKLPQPLLTGKAFPNLAHELRLEHEDTSVSLLQAIYERHDSLLTGSSRSTLWWGGLANFFWWIDPATGVAGVVATQRFPFYEPKVIDAVNRFKRLVNEEQRASRL